MKSLCGYLPLDFVLKEQRKNKEKNPKGQKHVFYFDFNMYYVLFAPLGSLRAQSSFAAGKAY